MMLIRRRNPALALIALAAIACSRAAPRAEPFEVARTSPALGAGAAPLLLNDSITIYFSAPVQPLSVTEDSVTVVDEAGRKVPGLLRVGGNWVTFEPEPPLAADLGDGSFRPGAHYRLLVAGSPRPDAVRSADGRRLVAPTTWALRIADLSERPPGMASLLRPPVADVPLLLRTPDAPQLLPIDAPRLRLHFTVPLLPTSVTAEALTIRLLRNLEVLRPRGLRAVTSRLDLLPGSSLEIDLGSQPQLASGGHTALRPGDCVSIELNAGPAALTDYAGVPVLPGAVQWWNVVAGSSIALAEWPSGELSYLDEDPLLPAFEVRAGVIRPRVRVEAGDGSLGVFRPSKDTILRPGMAFDRGDGQMVQSRGAEFPFTAVDVPVGVTVTVDATASPARILCCGSVRVAGTLRLVGDAVPLRAHRFEMPAAELAADARITVLAAGDLILTGAVRSDGETPPDSSPLTLLCAGRMHLDGELPFHALLAVEVPPADQREPAIVGPRGQAIVMATSFTYGLAPTADLRLRGYTPWRQLPPDRDGGRLRLVGGEPGMGVAWQSAAADPLAVGEPDRRLGRQSQPQPVLDGDSIALGAGGFIRLELSARLLAGMPIPTVREVLLTDR